MNQYHAGSAPPPAPSRHSEGIEPGMSVRIVSAFGISSTLVAVLCAPWWFGGVEARIQVFLYGLVLIGLFCGTIALAMNRSSKVRVPCAVIPLILAVLLGGLQLLPLSERALRAISPAGVELRSMVANRNGDLESWTTDIGIPERTARRPLSLYPASSRHDLALLVMAVSVFLLGALFFSNPRTHLWLFGLILVNGTAITFFGLTQKLSWNGMLYWSIPLTQGGLPFGPFVNRNNAGGYLILCFAAAVGATVWCLQRYLPTRLPAEAPGAHGIANRLRDTGWQAVEVLGSLNARTLGALTATGFLAAGILATLSRGAAASLVMATMLSVFIVRLAHRRSPSLAWLAVITAICIGLVSWVGIDDAMGGRWSNLWNSQLDDQARLSHWKDALHAVPDNWLVGSGLGTYRFVYPQYQKRFQEKWFYHAENQYIEALVESGIVGAILLFLTLGMVIVGVWRLLRWDPDPRSAAFAVGVILAVVGQSIASCFDFGLYIPANMMLFALICGAATGRSAQITRQGRELDQPSKSHRHAFAVLVMLMLGLGWLGRSELKGASSVEQALRSVRLDNALTSFEPNSIRPHIESLEQAVADQTDNPELHRRLAELWIQLYRAETLKVVREKMAFDDPDDPRLYQLTLPMVLHQRIHFLNQVGLTDELARLRQSNAIQENLLPAIKHLVLSRRYCPLLPEVHSGMAQLCGIMGNPAADQLHLKRLRRLAPGNPDLLYVSGLMEHHAGRVDLALDCWKKCLTLSDRYLDNVLELADPWLTREDVVEKLLPDSPQMLVQLARQRYAEESYVEVQRVLVNRAANLLERVDSNEADRYYLEAAICALRSEPDLALAHYAEAVQRQPDAFKWRYEYALLLRQQGQIERAYEQALWCTKLAPKYRRHSQLLDELRRQRAVGRSAPGSG
jgi:O-antigen ligase